MTKGWKPAPHKAPMLSNGLARLGVAAVAAPLAWRLVANIGLPLLVGAAAIAVAGTAVKSAVPEIPINREKIGIAALTGGGGIAAYYLSDLLPEKWKPAAYVAAVAGIASSVYFLFSPGEPKPPETVSPTGGTILPATVPEAQQVQSAPPGWLAQMLVVQLDPRQENTGGLTRSMLTDQQYGFAVRNQSNRTLGFFAGLDIRDDEQRSLFKSKPEPTTVGRKMYAIPSGGVVSDVLTAPPVNFWLPQTVTVGVQLFRNRDDEQPFLESQAIPIKMTYPLYAGVG